MINFVADVHLVSGLGRPFHKLQPSNAKEHAPVSDVRHSFLDFRSCVPGATACHLARSWVVLGFGRVGHLELKLKR